MDNRIIYICEGLHISDGVIKKSVKKLAKQSKFNKKIAIFTFSMAVYIAIADLKNRELKDKVEMLANELEELKHEKGE